MSDNDNKSPISIEYIIDLISSIKAALSNLDNAGSQNSDILSQISENLAVLSELYKKQNQDVKIQQAKTQEIIRAIDNLMNEIHVTSVQIISSNEKLSSNMEILSSFKKESLEDINKSLTELNKNFSSLQANVNYLKDRESQKELAVTIESMKKGPTQEKSNKSQQTENKEENFLSRVTGFFKNLAESSKNVYSILLLIAGVVLIWLWLASVITVDDIKNIVSFKFF